MLLGELLLLCGALHDISEKSKEPATQRQLGDVQESIQKLGIKYFPETMVKIKKAIDTESSK